VGDTKRDGQQGDLVRLLYFLKVKGNSQTHRDIQRESYLINLLLFVQNKESRLITENMKIRKYEVHAARSSDV
jgi:hypothetical protein